MKNLLGALVAIAISSAVPATANAMPESGCGDGAGSTLAGVHGSGFVGATGSCSVRPIDISGPSGQPILVVDCGYATVSDDRGHWNPQCGPTGYVCPAAAGNPHPHQFLTTLALADPIVAIAQWCAGGTNPVPTAAQLRQEVIRLLTAPAIGIAPATGTALVNIKTLLWVTTPTTKVLGQARLIGLPVQLRVRYLHTDFDYGDHTTGRLQPGPGTPYDPATDCGPCTTEFGHTYTQPGAVTITARTYWTADYRIAGQPWTPIPGEVTALNPATTTLQIRQAHSQLVTGR